MNYTQCRRSGFNFIFEGKTVDYCQNYKYLGIIVNEHLNFEKSNQDLCEGARRALSGIITKIIKNGGFPLKVYKILYESCVCSITDYGSEILGFHEHPSLEKIHNRAIRTFLGLGKNTPIPGIRAEMGWLEPRSRTQTKMIRMLHRLVCMPDSRLTKKIFLWDFNLTETSRISTWGKEARDILTRNNLNQIFQTSIFDLKSIIDELKVSLLNKDQLKFKQQCAMPKLRTYNLIADFSSPKMYLNKPLSFIQRKFLAKTRLGVLQLRIETGRYERPKTPAEQRICKQCSLDSVETEAHFILECPRHSFQREHLFSQIRNEAFPLFSDSEKLIFLLNNSDTVKQTSQYIIDAFDNRLIH